MGIPTQQILLGSALLAVVLLQTSQYALEEKKKKTNLKIFEKFALQDEKLLYHVIRDLGQKTKDTTTQNVSVAFSEAKGKRVKLKDLVGMLRNLEKSGIVKLDFVSIQDEPKLVWKT
jgi:hypothetical protein